MPPLEIARYGLLSVVDPVNHPLSETHWGSGFDYETEACYFDSNIIDICSSGSDNVVVADTGKRYFRVTPFGITAADHCLTPGFSVENRQARANRQLELVTQKALEKVLWNGVFVVDTGAVGYVPPTPGSIAAFRAEQRYLKKSGADGYVDANALAEGVTIALAKLERAYAACGAGVRGTIHMTRDVLTLAAAKGLIWGEDGDRLYTKNGSWIIAGAGYGGAIAATSEMYMTGPIQVDLSPVEPLTLANADGFLSAKNEMTFKSMRIASVFFDGCCHFRARVNVAE